jgi:hypothetical protein
MVGNINKFRNGAVTILSLSFFLYNSQEAQPVESHSAYHFKKA